MFDYEQENNLSGKIPFWLRVTDNQ